MSTSLLMIEDDLRLAQMVGEYLGVTLAEVKRRPLYFLKHSNKADPVSLHPSMASIEGKKC